MVFISQKERKPLSKKGKIILSLMGLLVVVGIVAAVYIWLSNQKSPDVIKKEATRQERQFASIGDAELTPEQAAIRIDALYGGKLDLSDSTKVSLSDAMRYVGLLDQADRHSNALGAIKQIESKYGASTKTEDFYQLMYRVALAGNNKSQAKYALEKVKEIISEGYTDEDQRSARLSPIEEDIAALEGGN